MAELNTTLFPPIAPLRHGMLAVDDLHTIYWEEVGNPNGIPVLFLHGGPGAGLSPAHRRFFDPLHYRVILFDQRGAGKSAPLGECRNNTTPLLIEDIERLRTMFGIEQWLVFGGSWGSTLALAYGQAHPERCLGFVLRGIFLCTQREIDFFLNGAEWFHPDVYDEFIAGIPPQERGDLLGAYHRRIMSNDPEVYWPAVRAWSRFEGRRVFLLPQPEEPPSDSLDLGVGRLESHYMANLGFFTDNQLLANVARIAHLPVVIVQGRYDVICPPVSAWRLHQAWAGSVMKMIPDAGHGAMETGITRALVTATEQFRKQRRFD
jgi:proline iminopeptidase